MDLSIKVKVILSFLIPSIFLLGINIWAFVANEAVSDQAVVIKQQGIVLAVVAKENST